MGKVGKVGKHTTQPTALIRLSVAYSVRLPKQHSPPPKFSRPTRPYLLCVSSSTGGAQRARCRRIQW